VWLYPDDGIGIFAGLAGPQRYDTTDILYDLMHALSDLVVFNVRTLALPEYGPVRCQKNSGRDTANMGLSRKKRDGWSP